MQQASNDEVMTNHPVGSVYEDAALKNERSIYSHLAMPNRTINTPANIDLMATPAPAAPRTTRSHCAQPMYAATNRNLDAQANDTSGAYETTLSDAEITRLKDEIYRDLMMRMKIDLERGG
jgi:hypothetical protein